MFQVFSSKREKRLNQEEEDLTSGVALLMLSHGADTHRLEVSSIVSSLFTHCLLLQLIASLLISEEDPKLKASLIGSATPINPKLDECIYPVLYGILDESSEVGCFLTVRSEHPNSRRALTLTPGQPSEVFCPECWELITRIF